MTSDVSNKHLSCNCDCLTIWSFGIYYVQGILSAKGANITRDYPQQQIAWIELPYNPRDTWKNLENHRFRPRFLLTKECISKAQNFQL